MKCASLLILILNFNIDYDQSIGFFIFLLAVKVQSTKGTISGCGSINSDGVGILSRNIYSSMFCNEVC